MAPGEPSQDFVHCHFSVVRSIARFAFVLVHPKAVIVVPVAKMVFTNSPSGRLLLGENEGASDSVADGEEDGDVVGSSHSKIPGSSSSAHLMLRNICALVGHRAESECETTLYFFSSHSLNGITRSNLGELNLVLQEGCLVTQEFHLCRSCLISGGNSFVSGSSDGLSTRVSIRCCIFPRQISAADGDPSIACIQTA